jgi:hypothetical protein
VEPVERISPNLPSSSAIRDWSSAAASAASDALLDSNSSGATLSERVL